RCATRLRSLLTLRRWPVRVIVLLPSSSTFLPPPTLRQLLPWNQSQTSWSQLIRRCSWRRLLSPNLSRELSLGFLQAVSGAPGGATARCGPPLQSWYVLLCSQLRSRD